MKNCRSLYWLLLIPMFSGIILSCSGKRYVIQEIQSSRILMDSTWDARVNPETRKLVDSYKHQLDYQMDRVVGESAQNMSSSTPQSLLTNLTSDVMKQYGAKYTGKPVDFAVCNVHGHRSALAKGPISVRNLYEVYSFDNLLVVLELDGNSVANLFRYYASNGGEGVSSDVQLTIKDKKIVSLTIGGQPVEPQRNYRIATLDYLADGNSGMKALTKAVSVFNTQVTLRDVMIDYIQKCTDAGKKVDSKLDDRIIIVK